MSIDYRSQMLSVTISSTAHVHKHNSTQHRSLGPCRLKYDIVPIMHACMMLQGWNVNKH